MILGTQEREIKFNGRTEKVTLYEEKMFGSVRTVYSWSLSDGPCGCGQDSFDEAYEVAKAFVKDKNK